MAEPIVKRLGEFLSYKGLNYSEISEQLGYASSEKIARLFRVEGAKPSADIIEDISNKFVKELNVVWWLTGKGQMILSNESMLKPAERTVFSRKKKESLSELPIIDLKAAATYNSGYSVDGYIEKMDAMMLPTSLIGYKKHLVFQTWGDSMHATLYDGDYVAASFVEPEEWEHIRDNLIYVVVTKSRGVNIKRIKNRLKEHGILRCRSDNRHHPAFNVNADDILEIWEVSCKLSFNLPNENENIYNRLDYLEDRVEKLESEKGKIQKK